MSKGPCKTITYTKPRPFCAARGRNDLDSNCSTGLIAKSITGVDITLRSEQHVTVFDIITSKRPPSNQSKKSKRKFA